MVKTCMMSFCKECKKSVCLYEEIVSRYIKKYYCVLCRKFVRGVSSTEE